MAEYEGIKIRGISNHKFIITFHSEQDMQLQNYLYEWFKEIKTCNNRELIQPRLAWIHFDGFPISVWSRESWNKIVGEWGTIISNCNGLNHSQMFQKNMVCIETRKVHDIDETIKILIGTEVYWIRIKEAKACFSKAEGIGQSHYKRAYSGDKLRCWNTRRFICGDGRTTVYPGF